MVSYCVMQHLLMHFQRRWQPCRNIVHHQRAPPPQSPTHPQQHGHDQRQSPDGARHKGENTTTKHKCVNAHSSCAKSGSIKKVSQAVTWIRLEGLSYHRAQIVLKNTDSYQFLSIVFVEPVQFRLRMAWDVTGHSHTLTRWYALLLCWHKYLWGLWNEMPPLLQQEPLLQNLTKGCVNHLSSWLKSRNCTNRKHEAWR